MNLMKIDGAEHLIVGIVIVSVFWWILPVWIAVAVTYPRTFLRQMAGQGVSEWRDIFGGMVGLLLGIL